MLAAEALAATIEETVNTVAELPEHVLENEMLLSDAVHEAFENAATSFFPNSMIKPEIRESGERHGMWTRLPAKSGRKRYARYSDTLPIEIPSRVARNIDSFGHTTLHDHLRDQSRSTMLGLIKVTSRCIKRFQEHARARLRAQKVSPHLSCTR